MASNETGREPIQRAVARATRRNISRRAVVKGGLGAGAAALAGIRPGFRAAGVGASQDAPRFDGVSLRVLTQTGPLISGPINFHAEEFRNRTGAQVEAVEAPNAELFNRAVQVAQSGGGDFDLLLLANTWMPDFVNLDYVIPLQPLIDRDQADPQLALDDIPQGIKLKNSYGGQAYTFIVDNDNQTMFYRKDILGNPQFQEAYRAATGSDLPNPPRTLTEFVQVAQFFSPGGGGADWSDQGEGYGFVTCLLRGAQSYWYSYPWTAPYTVVPTDRAPAQGIYLFTPDMEPLINTAGYVRGLSEFVEIVNTAHRPGFDTDRGAVITEMVQGRAVLTLDWGDIGPASVGEDSLVKNQVGFALTPGVNEYYDWQTDTWVTVEGEPHRAPTHAYNGWSYYITSQTENQEAAWEWIKFHGSPEISGVDVAAQSGYQPWRNSHSTNLQPWVDVGWDQAEAQTYIQTILAATDHPNAVFDPRIPGAARYQETLELYTNRALARELEPQDAMDQCAQEFNTITDELGRQAQVDAYAAHLNIMSPGA